MLSHLPCCHHHPGLAAGEGGCLRSLESLHLVSLKLVNPIPPGLVSLAVHAQVALVHCSGSAAALWFRPMFCSALALPAPACFWAAPHASHHPLRPSCHAIRSQWPQLAPSLTSLVWHDLRKPDAWDAAQAQVEALQAQAEPMEGAELFQVQRAACRAGSGLGEQAD